VVKARQIGLSTTLSIETTHSACTKSNYEANIISVNQEEASSKLRTGAALHASIPQELEPYGWKPVKYRDAEDALAFHMPPYTSTIISKPGTHAVRGGAKSVYFDEAAFIEKFPLLYQAGVPASIRGDNRFTVISTPLGQSGLFHSIITDRGKYPAYSIHIIPWWESRYMVREGALSDAIALAPTMGTEERVRQFGNEKLINEIFSSMDIMSFQTEMECMFVDETEAFFPWDLVAQGKDDTLKNDRYFEREDGDEISIGVDLAKKRDKTVFTVIRHYEIEGKRRWEIKFVYETQADYDDQFKTLRELVATTRASRVSIDATGLGAVFVEMAQKNPFGPLVYIEPIVFNNTKKENWATRFKGDLQQGVGRYPPIPEFMRQVHGIRRKKSETGFFRFSGETDDMFWSAVIGIYGEGHGPVKFYRLGS
jgi:phage FluMu gp28-like protein